MTELSIRYAKGMLINKSAFIARIGQVVGISSLVICLYYNKGRDDKDALQVLNSMFFVCIAQITLYMAATLMEFQIERTIFIREVASNMFNVLPFFISKIIVEMPIIFLMPLLECSISFWVVGYRHEAFL